MSAPAPSSAASKPRLRPRLAQLKRADRIYGHVFDAILEQRLPPGTKLSEEALGEIFGVSRTVIRKTLLRLSHEGVISVRRHHGAMVATPSAEDARQILEARRVAELAIVRQATRMITREQITELQDLVTEERASFERGDRGTGIRLSGEFHMLLALVANNALLTQFVRGLISQTSLIISQYEIPGNKICSYDEHADLIKVIKSRDEAAAVEAMDRHLSHIGERLNLGGEKVSADLREVFAHIVNGGSRQRARTTAPAGATEKKRT
jgi:DNA-binding GntR family transcriptional regulator